MSEQKKSKSLKVGTMMLSKNKETKYIVLGNNNPKGKPEYNYTVDIRITKANGEQIKLTNPKLFLNDPRKFSENPEKIPDFILSELVILPEQD